MRRNIRPRADLFGQIAVAFRALDQRGEAALRQLRGLIVGDVVHHLGVAAPHQHVGDRLADAVAAGDGDQMRLALGLGDVDQIGFLQPRRLREHRTGHRDVVVVRELAHQLGRRVRDRRERLRHFGARLGLDLDDQPAQHVVEQPDVIFVEVRRAVDEQIGDALDASRPLFLRAVLDDVFKLGNQRRRRGHSTIPAGRTHIRPLACNVRLAW